MKIIKKFFFFILMCLLLSAVTGCNSKEEVSLRSVDEMTDYVQSIIGEPVKYVRTMEFEEHKWALYIYMLEDRDIEFEVRAYIKADFFEGLQLSNYREVIEVKYEEAIMNDPYYVEERLKLAEKYGVSDVYSDEENVSYFYIEIEEFSELEKVAKYVKEVDTLYSFKEKKPKKVEHIDINIGASTVGAIFETRHGDDFEFSKTKKDEIEEAEFLEQLQIMYVFYGDFRDKRDYNVPDELWNELLGKT